MRNTLTWFIKNLVQAAHDNPSRAVGEHIRHIETWTQVDITKDRPVEKLADRRADLQAKTIELKQVSSITTSSPLSSLSAE